MLTGSRDNEAVIRGSKAVNMIYQLTNRVPVLIEQSHLERNEGLRSLIGYTRIFANTSSMGKLLVADLPSAAHSMSESM